ncbi:MAG: virulence factor BrkB family protein [Arenicellales bacterium]|nr:virulence factor BrkB family protein [Arenicellales bacterium]
MRWQSVHFILHSISFSKIRVKPLLKIWQFTKRVWYRLLDDHVQMNAAALAFTTVLALVPAAAVTLSMLSIFPVFEEWSRELENFVYRNFVPAAGDVIQSQLEEFIGQTGRLTAFGLLFLLVSALLLLFTIEETLNKIWRVQDSRTIIQRILSYWAVLTLAPLLMGASLSLTSYLVSTAFGNGDIAQLRTVFLAVLPFLFVVLAFVLLYMAVPNKRIKFKDALIGGVAAGLLFEITKRGFTWYISNFQSYEVIYGALSSIPIFLIWVYLSWLVVLIGAEITATLGESGIED